MRPAVSLAQLPFPRLQSAAGLESTLVSRAIASDGHSALYFYREYIVHVSFRTPPIQQLAGSVEVNIISDN